MNNEPLTESSEETEFIDHLVEYVIQYLKAKKRERITHSLEEDLGYQAAIDDLETLKEKK